MIATYVCMAITCKEGQRLICAVPDLIKAKARCGLSIGYLQEPTDILVIIPYDEIGNRVGRNSVFFKDENQWRD